MFRHWQRYLVAWFFCLAVWAVGLMPSSVEHVHAIEEEPMPEYAFEEDMAILVHAVHAYYGHYGEYPADGYGLEQLAVTDTKTPDELVRWGRAVTECLLDPWGRPYLFIREAPAGPREFGIYSMGADGKSASQGEDPDDLNTWSGTQDYYIRHAKTDFVAERLLKWLLYAHLTFFIMAVMMAVISRSHSDEAESVIEILDD